MAITGTLSTINAAWIVGIRSDGSGVPSAARICAKFRRRYRYATMHTMSVVPSAAMNPTVPHHVSARWPKTVVGSLRDVDGRPLGRSGGGGHRPRSRMTGSFFGLPARPCPGNERRTAMSDPADRQRPTA